MQYLAIFSTCYGFLTDIDSSGNYDWDFHAEKPLIFTLRGSDNKNKPVDDFINEPTAFFVDPGEFRKLEREEAISELISAIDDATPDDIAFAISRLIGKPCKYKYGDWIIDGPGHDIDDVKKLLSEHAFSHSSLCDTLDIVSKHYYWTHPEGDDEIIYSTPVPSLDNFKSKADDLLEQLLNHCNFHLKEAGNSSEDCQLVGLRQALSQVQMLINGTESGDIKPLFSA